MSENARITSARRPRLVVLVNGPEKSAAAERARELFTRGQTIIACDVTFHFRDTGKAKATLRFFKTLLVRRPALVYVVDMAFSGVLAAAAYRTVARHSRLVIDTGDAILALAKKMGNRGPAALRFTAFLERLGQRTADRLVVRGSGHLDYLGKLAGKAVVIQDGVNAGDYAGVSPIDCGGAFTADAPLIVGVLGSLNWNAALGWCYGMELVEALQFLGDRHVRGVIIGDGDGLAHLKKRAEELKVSDRIDFVDRVPPEQLPAVLGTFHVALSTQTNDVVGQVRTTGKLPLYMAAGRYVLASRVGEAARLLPDEMLIDYDGEFDRDYPRRLAGVIAALADDRSKLALAHGGPERVAPLEYAALARRLDATLSPLISNMPQRTQSRSAILYLALGVHRRGGMERAAYEVINRLNPQRPVIVIARESDCEGVLHDAVWAPRRPAMVEVTWYKWRARRAARKYSGCISTGIGASGGPVEVVVAQYCQEAFRQRIGTVRANGPLQAWWHRRNMARFCAEERAVYQSPKLKRVIAVSHGVGRELIEFYGVDERIIRYIPNGVDLSVFRPADADEKRNLRQHLGLPADGLLACFVGGDWRRKGLRAAIEAMRDLDDVHLVIAGAGNQDEFSAHAAAAGVGARVHFVGKRPNPESYMRASDIYVFPSSYEAFSLSCIEAAACGLPLLVTRINGAEELVTDGVNGFFVEQNGPSIADKLRRLRDDLALRASQAAAAAEEGRRYDWDVIAAAHEKVYEELDATRG